MYHILKAEKAQKQEHIIASQDKELERVASFFVSWHLLKVKFHRSCQIQFNQSRKNIVLVLEVCQTIYYFGYDSNPEHF